MREVVGPLLDQVVGPAQHLAALARGGPTPVRLGGDRGVEGGARVVQGAVGDVGQHRAVGRVEDVEPGAVPGVAPLAGDEESAVLRGEEIKSVHAPTLAPRWLREQQTAGSGI